MPAASQPASAAESPRLGFRATTCAPTTRPVAVDARGRSAQIFHVEVLAWTAGRW
jgi:hypothetical protein